VSDTTSAAETGIPESPVEAMDAGGREVVFITNINDGDSTMRDEVFCEGETGEVLNDAIWARNAYLEEKYNIKIAVSKEDRFFEDVPRTVMAGDPVYDIAMPGLGYAFNWGGSDYLTEVSQLTHVNPDAEWWNQHIIEETEVQGKSYLLLGSMNLIAFDSTSACYFNKDMLTANGLDAPYSMVQDGTWTFDAMMEMCKDVGGDLNGDGNLDEKDAYGFGCNSYGAPAFAYAAGASFTERDEDGIPHFVELDERFVTFYQKLIETIHTNESVIYGERWKHPERVNYLLTAFNESRMLFYVDTLVRTLQLREMEMDYGIVPVPKADEEQARYHSFIHAEDSSVVCVPKTVTELDLISRILEDMAYYSHFHVYPEYIDTTIKGKYLRDPESAEMVDLIISSQSFDFSLSSRSAWTSDLRNILTNANTNIVSAYDAKRATYETNLQKLIEQMVED